MGLGVGEGEMGCVEEVAVERFEAGDGVRRSVERIADDWVAKCLHVHTNLVGTASLDADFDQREGAVSSGDALDDLDVGDGVADAFMAERAAGGHAGAADEVAADGQLDGDGIFRQVAVDEREVGLGNLALAEHLAKLAVGAVVFGDEDEAAGQLVEPVDDAGAEVAADG